MGKSICDLDLKKKQKTIMNLNLGQPFRDCFSNLATFNGSTNVLLFSVYAACIAA